MMQQFEITLPWHGCRGLLLSPAALLTQDRDSAGSDPEAATHHLGRGLSVVRKQIPPVPKERASSTQSPEPLKAEMITTFGETRRELRWMACMTWAAALRSAGLFTSLVSLPPLPLPAYVNSHLNHRYLYSQDILLAIFCPLPCS